jgi:membrane protease YdiL (CAAX protease family)
MYEELVYRGFLFAAFYGAVAGETFRLKGSFDRRGLLAATIGSCILFAAGHEQYAVDVRVALGVTSLVFVWPWVRTRSLWAPWIVHMIGDLVGDTFLIM